MSWGSKLQETLNLNSNNKNNKNSLNELINLPLNVFMLKCKQIAFQNKHNRYPLLQNLFLLNAYEKFIYNNTKNLEFVFVTIKNVTRKDYKRVMENYRDAEYSFVSVFEKNTKVMEENSNQGIGNEKNKGHFHLLMLVKNKKEKRDKHALKKKFINDYKVKENNIEDKLPLNILIHVEYFSSYDRWNFINKINYVVYSYIYSDLEDDKNVLYAYNLLLMEDHIGLRKLFEEYESTINLWINYFKDITDNNLLYESMTDEDKRLYKYHIIEALVLCSNLSSELITFNEAAFEKEYLFNRTLPTSMAFSLSIVKERLTIFNRIMQMGDFTYATTGEG